MENSLQSGSEIVVLQTESEAQQQAFADAATSGARVHLTHVYQQGGRTHLTMCMSNKMIVEMAKLNSADKKDNRADVDEFVNRPINPRHVDEIARYLEDRENYILPAFTFNSRTPLRVYAYGKASVKFGYALLPTDLELYVTDGQHRIKALDKIRVQRPEIMNDGATVVIVQEDDLAQIHQDFVDCARSQPISPSMLTAFDSQSLLPNFTRILSKESVLFSGRIDMISRTLGKSPYFLFTMNQLRICAAEFLFGSSAKRDIDSRSPKLLQSPEDRQEALDKAISFYHRYAEFSNDWSPLLEPAERTKKVDIYELRQQRLDFNVTIFQVISRLGHFLMFGEAFANLTEQEQEDLIRAIADVNFNRDAELWQGKVVIDGRLLTQRGVIDDATAIAAQQIAEKTGINLMERNKS
ncbi:DNA sulfur modification protein DndB [Chamaesiphon sp. OTE_8_metabat_110]|uniref:DNA sulfur modification protein DndB n=1 Tax=Chamaesiphon sp. OTE_8_metabat_110 TaxID=2964696 RepID=UPI00286C3602|nr:DNA sulfur modification protein DndB [Chamaesiphon sp. OTE_8_metabat_110]